MGHQDHKMTHITTNLPEDLLTRAVRLSSENPAWAEIWPPIEMESTKHRLVGELMRAVRFCDPSWVITEEQKDLEYWVGRSMMSPGFQVMEWVEALTRARKEFSTPVAA